MAVKQPRGAGKPRRPAPRPSQEPRAAAFVPLSTLKQVPASPDAILAEIRRIYFKTSARTVEADLAHAVALLKALPDEETREKATVFMHGLSEMQREWQAPKKPARAAAPPRPKAKKTSAAKKTPKRRA